MSTVNVQGRIDMKSLATVAMAYLERGSTFSTRSDLMWKIVEDAAVAAERCGAVRPETDESALHFLRSVGLDLEMSKRGTKEVRRALVQDTGVHDHYGEDLFSRRVTKGGLTGRGKAMPSVYVEGITEVSLFNSACDVYRAQGAEPPWKTFEEFVEAKRKIENEGRNSEPAPQEGVDMQAFEAKEAKRLAAEKAAYSPEALRTAMKGGEGE